MKTLDRNSNRPYIAATPEPMGAKKQPNQPVARPDYTPLHIPNPPSIPIGQDPNRREEYDGKRKQK